METKGHPSLEGRYVIEGSLAEGGMAEVFVGKALGARGFEKRVVIKRIKESAAREDWADALFVNEAKLMSELVHPNIVQVLDFGRGDAGENFLVLEHVEGLDLGRLRVWYAKRGERFPVALALFVVRETLRALHHLGVVGEGRGQAIVHRDVSPENILVSRLGEVKMADFGVATMAARGTQDDWVVGKPAFMAPEVWARGEVDARSDLFSLGVVLHLLVTHERPWSPRDAEEAVAVIRRGIAPSAEYPEGLHAIVSRAVVFAPSDRYRDARDMMKAIDALPMKLATADELAEIVSEAFSEVGLRAAPVRVLGEALRREVTRFDGGAPFSFVLEADVARITQRIDDEPLALEEKNSPRAGDDDPRATVPTATRRWPVAVLAMLGLVGATIVGLLVSRTASRDDAPGSSSGETVTSRVVSAAPSSTTFEAPLVDVTAPESAVPSAGMPPPLGSSLRGRLPSPTGSVAAPSNDCSGQVLFAADHAWSISGGPRRAEAPGSFVWPCGSYAVVATSRLDPSKKQVVSVTIRQGVTARRELR